MDYLERRKIATRDGVAYALEKLGEKNKDIVVSKLKNSWICEIKVSCLKTKTNVFLLISAYIMFKGELFLLTLSYLD